MNPQKKVIISGGGLVGTLCAIFLAKRKGYQIKLFERRDDIRSTEDSKTAINLILSDRGRKALSAVGIEDAVLNLSTPIYGRVLHYLKDGTLNTPYDVHSNQCDYSINRNDLNGLLLTEAEKHSNIEIYFNHELTELNFDEGTVTCLDLKTDITKIYQGDLIIGADGTHSVVRRFMVSNKMISDFDRRLVKHIYLKLTVSKERGQSLTPNRYHMWPRGNCMMSALPNKDDTWTLMMFAPVREYEGMYFKEAKAKEFLQVTFPEAFTLIGDSFVTEYCTSKIMPMHSILSAPYHAEKKILIIGDAAHPIVPYCNQGMNAGFEDCNIFNDILSEKEDDIDSAVQEWSNKRVKDGHALFDISMRSYEDTFGSTKKYFLKQWLDQFLFRVFPKMWIPTYVSLAFGATSYEMCRDHQNWQNKVTNRICWFTIIVSMWAIYLFLFCYVM